MTTKPPFKLSSRAANFLIAFIAIALSLSLAKRCGEDEKTTQRSPVATSAAETPRAAPKPESAPEPIVAVTAPALFAAYDANEISADDKFKGKMLAVTGKIDSIGKDILDTMYLTLSNGEEFAIMGVQAFFEDDAGKQLARLTKGQKVTVLCRCDGKLGNVMLKECSLK